MEKNKIYLGNNLDVLKTFPDNYFDSVVTDPPYGLGKEPNVYEVMKDWIEKGYHEIKGKGFMGKEWDAFVPQPILWKEVFRVLKPGGFVLSFAGTRTYDWMVMGLRFAGFEVRDMVAWLYGNGFPKSHDISKGIDKMQGIKHPKNKLISKNNSMSGGNYTRNKMAVKSNLAKQWQGWGTALKPAIEPIVMARKPFKGTVAENVLKYGTGGINIDGCKVGTEKRTQFSGKGTNGNVYHDYPQENAHYETVSGRFPANVIHDGSDEVVKLFPESSITGHRSQESINNCINSRKEKKGNSQCDVGGNIDKITEYGGDGGSAARFFKKFPFTEDDRRLYYIPKASKAERNMGLYGFEEKETRGGGGRVEKGYNENNEEERKLKESARKYGAVKAKKRNIHPTVKPIDLMRYLIRLVTPKGGIVLDPYIGSGTTAIAAKKEKMDYVGIELEEEYLNIAKARIKATIVEYDIFDYL